MRAAIATIVVMTMALAGCGDDSARQRDGRLRLAQVADVITLDPTRAVDNESIRVLSQVVEPLFKTDAAGKVVPWLARGARQSRDGRSWTIRLRQGIRFSDGRPLTADDVVFSLDSARKSANWGFLLAAVTRVEARSPHSVRIATRRPLVPLLANLSLFANGIVPKDLGGRDQKAFARKPIGTGPFTVGARVPGESITLERNPRYWRPGRPRLRAIEISAIPDDNSRMSQLRAGELDIAASPPWTQMEALRNTPQLHVGTYALSQSNHLTLNVRDERFRDRRVREAVSLAIDRRAIVKAALRGNGRVGSSFIAPSLLHFDRTLPTPRFDPARAKRLLGGRRLRFTLLVTAGETLDATIAQLIQKDLEAVGVDVELQPVDQAAQLDLTDAGKYQASLGYIVSDIVDPSELTAYYVGTKAYRTGADTKAVGALGSAADSERDPRRRAALYARIQRLVQREHNVLPLIYQPYAWAMRDAVTGFDLNPTGIYWLADVGYER